MYHLCVLRHSLALGGPWWCLAALKTPLLLLGGSLAFSDKTVWRPALGLICGYVCGSLTRRILEMVLPVPI